MVRVEAYVRLGELEAVLRALAAAGLPECTCREARAHGPGVGLDSAPRWLVEVVVDAPESERAVAAFESATAEPVFLSEVERASG